MKIEVSIPALDRLVDFLEKGGIPSLTSTALPASTEPAKPASTRAPRGGARPTPPPAETPAEEPESPSPEPEKPKSTHTLETVSDLARAFIGKTSPAASRKLLDESGFKGLKLGEIGAEHYDVLAAAFEKAIKDHDDSGL